MKNIKSNAIAFVFLVWIGFFGLILHKVYNMLGKLENMPIVSAKPFGEIFNENR